LKVGDPEAARAQADHGQPNRQRQDGAARATARSRFVAAVVAATVFAVAVADEAQRGEQRCGGRKEDESCTHAPTNREKERERERERDPTGT
jgi:hypothetical protein